MRDRCECDVKIRRLVPSYKNVCVSIAHHLSCNVTAVPFTLQIAIHLATTQRELPCNLEYRAMTPRTDYGRRYDETYARLTRDRPFANGGTSDQCRWKISCVMTKRRNCAGNLGQRGQSGGPSQLLQIGAHGAVQQWTSACRNCSANRRDRLIPVILSRADNFVVGQTKKRGREFRSWSSEEAFKSIPTGMQNIAGCQSADAHKIYTPGDGLHHAILNKTGCGEEYFVLRRVGLLGRKNRAIGISSISRDRTAQRIEEHFDRSNLDVLELRLGYVKVEQPCTFRTIKGLRI